MLSLRLRRRQPHQQIVTPRLRFHVICAGLILLTLLLSTAAVRLHVRRRIDEEDIHTSIFHASSIPRRRLDEISAAIPRELQITLAVVLSLLSSLSSGLTLGLMTLDVVQLEVMAEGSTTTDRKLQREAAMAKRVLAVRRDGNLVLVSLLLLNVSVNSAFSILSSELTSGLVGLLVSTSVITVFGEILPQAVCAKYGLQAGYYLYPAVVVTECVLYVIAKPTALLLDKLLGRDIGTAYSREQLKALVEHHERALNVLRHEEMQIVSGGLDVARKHVGDVMTPLSAVFGVELNGMLNFDTAAEVILSGYSRVPVFDWERPDCIVGVFHAKDIALIDPNECLPLSSVMALYGRCTYAVDMDMSLLDLLREFKTGRSHLAVVREAVEGDGSTDPFYRHVGIITLEDVLEEILQDEIYDEYEQKGPARSTSKISSCPAARSLRRIDSHTAHSSNLATRLPLEDAVVRSAVGAGAVAQTDRTESPRESPRLPTVQLTVAPPLPPPQELPPLEQPQRVQQKAVPTVVSLQIPTKGNAGTSRHPDGVSSGIRSCASPSWNTESWSEAPLSNRQQSDAGMLKKRSGGRDAAAGRLRLLSRRQHSGSCLTANETQAVAMFLAHSLPALQLPYLSPAALVRLVTEAHVVSPPPKTAVFERGENCDHMVLVLQGKVKLVVGGSEALECSLGPWSLLGTPVLGPVDWKGLKVPAGASGEVVESIVERHFEEALARPFVPEYTATVTGETRSSSNFTPVRLLLVTRKSYVKAVAVSLGAHLIEQRKATLLAHKSAATTAGAGTCATFDDETV